MISSEELGGLKNARVRTSNGEELGRVGLVYADDGSGRPEWVTVDPGTGGGDTRFVPLQEGQLVEGDVVVPYTAEQVGGAPWVDPDQGHLSRTQEADLYAHYGLFDPTDHPDVGLLVDARTQLPEPNTPGREGGAQI